MDKKISLGKLNGCGTYDRISNEDRPQR